MTAEHDDEGCALALHFRPDLPCADDEAVPPPSVDERLASKYRRFTASLSPDEFRAWHTWGQPLRQGRAVQA